MQTSAKITFDSDDNYLELRQEDDKIIIILSSRSPKDVRKLTITSAEVEKEKFLNLIKQLDLI